MLRNIILMLAAFSLLCTSCNKDKEYVGDGSDNGGSGGTDDAAKWISEILEYRPAPGQFINSSLGSQEAAETLIGGEGSVSLGGFGGYIVFRFDHTVSNKPGYDFVIKGNAFAGSSEPGIVMVSADANGNGLADDTWYELAGSDYSLTSTVKNYEITYYKPSQTDNAEDIRWTDNQDGSGWIYDMSSYGHTQSYWPSYAAGMETIVFTGTKLGDLVRVDDDGSYYNGAAGTGYADNYSSEYAGTVNGDPDTANSNKFDISDAVDTDGNAVRLESMDFIKVYTGVNQTSGSLGEASTEITGAISLRVPE